MVNLGRFNQLTVVRQLPRGLQLDAGGDGEILLPKQYIDDSMKVGSVVEVFIYRDSEDRLIATTETPKAQVGEFAFLNVADESKHGAFLDWGLPKDLFVPFSEQNNRLEKGRQALVRVYVDDSGRIAASAKIDTFLYDEDETDLYKAGDEINITVAGQSDLGRKVIINNTHWGLVYHSDIFEPISRGDKLKAYIKRVREDKKIEVSLQKIGFAKVEGLAGVVLERLQNENGHIALSDKSNPEDIKRAFKCSKNAYKQAIGVLYKQRLIRIEKDGIYLNK
ncbi:S1 RNA-binding domain-containing protein [Bermanella sp. R86510]|uniref:CvfB family protein n=1 Tax=unclassified Bermanella TaxID=2627862 RepID=UPI0037C55B68